MSDLARRILIIDGLAGTESDDHEALARIVVLAREELGIEQERRDHDRLLAEWDAPIR